MTDLEYFISFLHSFLSAPLSFSATEPIGGVWRSTMDTSSCLRSRRIFCATPFGPKRRRPARLFRTPRNGRRGAWRRRPSVRPGPIKFGAVALLAMGGERVSTRESAGWSYGYQNASSFRHRSGGVHWHGVVGASTEGTEVTVTGG